MTITCPNCGEAVEFYNQGREYEALCDCGFRAEMPVCGLMEPERWEETT